jgi:predicted SnoaL-like aldol condensation-catalyzing enzyme
MSAANKDLVARLHADVLDTGDLAPIDELVHPDYLNHEAAPGTPRGRDGFRHTVGLLRGGFPDLRFVIEELVAEDDRVVVRCLRPDVASAPSTSTSTASRTTWSPSTGPAATTSAAFASSASSPVRADGPRYPLTARRSAS